MLVNNETYISFIRSKVGLNAVLLKFLGRQRRPYIVFRNRFLYGFMFVYIYNYNYVCIYISVKMAAPWGYYSLCPHLRSHSIELKVFQNTSS